jgi:curved DNA-binding protein CbpA
MNDPYQILGVKPEDDDQVIRARYLERIKAHTPERDPQMFAAIRAAYEKLKNLETRVRQRVFEPAHRDTIDSIIEEVKCRTPRRRYSLSTLLTMAREAPKTSTKPKY